MSDRSLHERAFELLPMRGLGALDAAEEALVERHLAEGCEECERELRSWAETVSSLPDGLDAASASPELRAAVLDRIADEPQDAAASEPLEFRPRADESPAPEPSPSSAWWLVAAAAIVAAIALGLFARSERGRVNTLLAERAQLQERVEVLEGEVQSLAVALAAGQETQRIITSSGLVYASLQGQGDAADASGHAFVDPSAREAVFFARGLEGLAEDLTYQLWYIADGVPVSAGIFDTDDAGVARVVVADTGDPSRIQTWAVTVEPAGGVPQPTGDMVLVGSLAI